MTDLHAQYNAVTALHPPPKPGDSVVLWVLGGEDCSAQVAELEAAHGVKILLCEVVKSRPVQDFMTADVSAAADLDGQCHTGDPEADHLQADLLLCELLGRMGFAKTVAAFKAVVRWFA